MCHWGSESLRHTGFGMGSLGCGLNSSCGGYQDLQLGPRWGGRDKEHSNPVSQGSEERQAAPLSQVQQVFTCYLLTSGPAPDHSAACHWASPAPLGLSVPICKLGEWAHAPFQSWVQDFPGGPLAKTPRPQCRRPRLNSWSGSYIPRAAT